MFRYAITIFLSAFLLFQVQPLIGKFILPWFGGTPAVWTTCLLFFQAALLAGYSYAHFISSKVSPRGQMLTHLALLIASLAFLPIMPSDTWKPMGDEMPIGRILAMLAASIGLPYFMLSTTGPLLQESYRRETGHPPYRLYALSNVGSLLALLSYPFVFEPGFSLGTQIKGWSIAYGVFAAFCGWCALSFIKPAHHPEIVDATAGTATESAYQAPPSGRDILFWLALAACGSALLLSTTNLLCQEICSIPFLWVLPLALYLTTFIICFDHERWYHRPTFMVLLIAAVGAAAWGLDRGTSLELSKQLIIFGGTLWVCCMVCHGELTRSKPAAHYATLFYLMVSAGGVIGGLLVAIVAPMVLNGYYEYHASLAATLLLAAFALGRDKSPETVLVRRVLIPALMLSLGVLVAYFSGTIWQEADEIYTTMERSRNFYGVLRVVREDDPDDYRGPSRQIIHGRIGHGYQYEDPERAHIPTSYFGPHSGVGLAIEHHPRRATGPMRIGILGLGCGSLAVYGRPGDVIRYYEINPDVIRVANEFFTYCSGSKAQIDFVLGDARIKMEQEIAAGQAQKFDVLVADAFSSDAIPMHLLTLECAELYKQELAPDGILCIHITNRFVDLLPVVRGLAEKLGYECLLIDSEYSHDDVLFNHARWMVLTNNKEFLRDPDVIEAMTPFTSEDEPPVLWTDDYGSVWKVLVKEE